MHRQGLSPFFTHLAGKKNLLTRIFCPHIAKELGIPPFIPRRLSLILVLLFSTHLHPATICKWILFLHLQRLYHPMRPHHKPQSHQMPLVIYRRSRNLPAATSVRQLPPTFSKLNLALAAPILELPTTTTTIIVE